jgi:hypothetical protein
MDKPTFTVKPEPEMGHGMFSIPLLGLEHVELMYGMLVELCGMPVGPNENGTSAAYRKLAEGMRDEFARAIAPQGPQPTPNFGPPTRACA